MVENPIDARIGSSSLHQVGTEKARREEEERAQEQVCLVAEARAREEEQRACEEKERLAVKQDLCEVEGPSWERVP